jgi:hypothetical protein
MHINLTNYIRQSLLKDACGCAMGARFLFIGILTTIPYYWWSYKQQSINGFSAFIHAFIFLFLLSGLGKVIGILLNRLALRKTGS